MRLLQLFGKMAEIRSLVGLADPLPFLTRTPCMRDKHLGSRNTLYPMLRTARAHNTGVSVELK